MEKIYRGTTPTFTVEVDADISDMDIYLTFAQGRVRIVKTGDDLDVAVDESVTVITCKLTQDETLMFAASKNVEVQIRAVRENGTVALATTIDEFSVRRVLQEGVLA